MELPPKIRLPVDCCSLIFTSSYWSSPLSLINSSRFPNLKADYSAVLGYLYAEPAPPGEGIPSVGYIMYSQL